MTQKKMDTGYMIQQYAEARDEGKPPHLIVRCQCRGLN
jgi:hypothetical protein